jgi:hypothetical protein
MRAAFAVEPSALGGDPVAQARKLLGPLVGDSLAGNKPYFLMVTRAFLDGMPVSDWPGGNPAADALVRLLLGAAPTGDPDREEKVRTSVAVVTALITGWILLEDQLLDIVQLADSRRETARELLLDAVDAIVRGAFDADPAPGGGRS